MVGATSSEGFLVFTKRCYIGSDPGGADAATAQLYIAVARRVFALLIVTFKIYLS